MSQHAFSAHPEPTPAVQVPNVEAQISYQINRERAFKTTLHHTNRTDYICRTLLVCQVLTHCDSLLRYLQGLQALPAASSVRQEHTLHHLVIPSFWEIIIGFMKLPPEFFQTFPHVFVSYQMQMCFCSMDLEIVQSDVSNRLCLIVMEGVAAHTIDLPSHPLG
jgi:hypothetical protein